MATKIRRTNNETLYSLQTGMGMPGKDKRQSAYFASQTLPPDEELQAIYRHAGIGKRIIDVYATEMTRAGWEISGDAEGVINAKLEEMHFIEKIADMIRWSRLFGGSIIMLGINDGQDFIPSILQGSLKTLLRIIR